MSVVKERLEKRRDTWYNISAKQCLAYQNINGGNKTQSSCNKLILNKGSDYLEMKIDTSYGLGKLKYVSDSSPLMWCADYNKTYFNLVKDKDLTLTKGDVICWSGEYKIYSV